MDYAICSLGTSQSLNPFGAKTRVQYVLPPILSSPYPIPIFPSFVCFNNHRKELLPTYPSFLVPSFVHLQIPNSFLSFMQPNLAVMARLHCRRWAGGRAGGGGGWQAGWRQCGTGKIGLDRRHATRQRERGRDYSWELGISSEPNSDIFRIPNSSCVRRSAKRLVLGCEKFLPALA